MFRRGHSLVSQRGTRATPVFPVVSLVVTVALMTSPAAGNIMAFAIPDMVQYGSCANVQTIERFDFPRFTGIWYQVEDVPNSYVEVTQCSRSVYMWDGSQFNVISEGWDEFGEQTDQITSISQVQPASPDQPHPYLQIRSPNVPPVPYHIINTDYVSFACVYSCFEFLGLKVEIYSILSRTSKATNASLAACHDSLGALGVDLASLEPVPQGDECWYNDPEELVAVESSRVTVSQTSQGEDSQAGAHNHHHHHHHRPAVSTHPTTRAKFASEGREVIESQRSHGEVPENGPHHHRPAVSTHPTTRAKFASEGREVIESQTSHGEVPENGPHHHHHHHRPAVSTHPTTRAKFASEGREVIESQTSHGEVPETGPHHHHHHHAAISTLLTATVRMAENVAPAVRDPDENAIEDIDEFLSLMVEDMENVDDNHSHHGEALGVIKTTRGNSKIRPVKTNINLQRTSNIPERTEKNDPECNTKTSPGCSDSNTRGQPGPQAAGSGSESRPTPAAKLYTNLKGNGGHERRPRLASDHPRIKTCHHAKFGAANPNSLTPSFRQINRHCLL